MKGVPHATKAGARTAKRELALIAAREWIDTRHNQYTASEQQDRYDALEKALEQWIAAEDGR
jgi:hypothetical protein